MQNVALNKNGTILAVGQHGNDGPNGAVNAGRAHLRRRRGMASPGHGRGRRARRDASGKSVALSADGNVLAVGGPNNNGNDPTDVWRGHVACLHGTPRTPGWVATSMANPGTAAVGSRSAAMAAWWPAQRCPTIMFQTTSE